MMKKAKITIIFLSIYSLCFFGLTPVARAVDGSDPTGINGHVMNFSGGAKAVCENCHIPHAAKGKKIWARTEIENKQDVTVRDLCESCHHEGFADFANLSGVMAGLRTIDGYTKNGNVCTKDGEDDNLTAASHVMGSEYKGKRHTKKAEVPNIFPMDSDEEGFYCGSCHNPHKQPLKCGTGDGSHGNGDYLRAVEGVDVGTEHNRQGFCRQCHPEDGTLTGGLAQIHKDTTATADLKCDECHHVHDGKKYKNPTPAQAMAENSIFWMECNPGWLEFPPRPGNPLPTDGYFESSTCVGCHVYSTDEGFPKINPNKGHHPMGKIWAETSCGVVDSCHPLKNGEIANLTDNKFPLDGTTDETGNTPLEPSKQRFSCISCHANHTEVVPGNPAFLRFASFKEDDTALCEYCHNSTGRHQKSGSLLKAKGDDGNLGKHFKTQSEGKSLTLQRRVWDKDTDTYDYDVGCGGCMFCHFIHSNEVNDSRTVGSGGNTDPLRADIDSLMRVAPITPLNWGRQQEYGQTALRSITKTDARYEDLCYACHGKISIVGQAMTGSLLNINKFSHRFACAPVSDNTKANTSRICEPYKEAFPLGDGYSGPAVTAGVMDDYGTVKDKIFCGTCHDVHINNKPPYLYPFYANQDTSSPYLADDPETPVIEGFCEQCHCTAENPDPMSQVSTHPVGPDKIPSLKTATEWPEKFYGGKSGSDHGITSDNNTVNSSTPQNGGTKDGGVLCLSCHNVHAAATAWDGTVTGETPPTNRTDKGPHGQLVVLDNYSAEPGSNMCVECHPQFE